MIPLTLNVQCFSTACAGGLQEQVWVQYRSEWVQTSGGIQSGILWGRWLHCGFPGNMSTYSSHHEEHSKGDLLESNLYRKSSGFWITIFMWQQLMRRQCILWTNGVFVKIYMYIHNLHCSISLIDNNLMCYIWNWFCAKHVSVPIGGWI